MNKILSLGGRLNRLIERTEEEAEQIIARAQSKADKIVNTAQREATQRLQRAQRRSGLNEFLKEAEEEAKIEAKKVLEDYYKRAKEIRSVPDSELKEASKIFVREVLSLE
jgi:vacuolar-type H+-ATPase subunit H